VEGADLVPERLDPSPTEQLSMAEENQGEGDPWRIAMKRRERGQVRGAWGRTGSHWSSVGVQLESSSIGQNCYEKFKGYIFRDEKSNITIT
jgi:hypothetical protein